MSANELPPSQMWAVGKVFFLPKDYDVDEGSCVKCGGQLDTGWECNDCGADHMFAVHRLIKEREKP
jgi:hypothetical protein